MSKFCCIILHRFSSLAGTNSLRRSAFFRNRTQQAQSLLYVLNQLATHPAKGNKYNASKMGEEKKKITFACPVSSLKEPRIHNLLPTRSGGSTTHTRVLTGKLSTSEKDGECFCHPQQRVGPRNLDEALEAARPLQRTRCLVQIVRRLHLCRTREALQSGEVMLK